MSISEELTEQLERGNVLPFVGERISRDAPRRAHRLLAGFTDCDVLVTTCLDRPNLRYHI